MLLVLKMQRDLIQEKYVLTRRPDVMILPPAMLVQDADGNCYYDKSYILKAYVLTKGSAPQSTNGSEPQFPEQWF